MRIRACSFLLAIFLSVGLAMDARAQSNHNAEGPNCVEAQPSLGRALCLAGQRPLHILYIHGIGAEQAGDSWDFQKRLCRFLHGCKLGRDPVAFGKRDFADGEPFASGKPPDYRYMGNQVWTEENWPASRPFVDHYVLRRADGGPVVLDEINWWPLVDALKCRYIMVGEASLAGPDKHLLDLCSGKKDPHHPHEQPYAWIDPGLANTLELLPARGARFNRGVKNSLMDWGFADPMIAVGPVRELFREAMRQLLVKSASFDPDTTVRPDEPNRNPADDNAPREFVVVSHSLGSFLVFSTLRDPVTAGRCVALQNEPTPLKNNDQQVATETKEDRAVCYIMAHTSAVYFLANQIPLLYLATTVPPQPAGTTQPGTASDFSAQIETLQSIRAYFGETKTYFTAFSDPSDLLSWQFPAMGNTAVENCHVRNTFWHWLIASPEGAHTNYAENKDVVRIMNDPEKYGRRSCSQTQ